MKQAILFFSLVISSTIFSQNNCVNYILVCGNQSISLNVSGGGIQEISNSSFCFSQENNSIWLKFTIQSGGTLGFNLIPASTNISEDYDFMIFGPNVSCSNLGSPIRCSSTNPSAAGSSNNHTGLRPASSDVSEGPGNLGDNWLAMLNVSAGQSYYLLIDRPIGNAAFTLNWTGTAGLKKTDAGPDQQVCKGKATTMAATETGTWIQHATNPAPVVFSSVTNPSATVSGLNTVGVYKYTWSSLGCADTMQITVNPTHAASVTKSICQGQTYQGHSTTGTYTDILKNNYGCDSVVTLTLTILNKSTSTINKTICQGESFLGYTTTGTFTDILVNSVGCDSTRTLNLTVNPSHAKTIVKGICDGESFMGKNATGIYTFNYKNSYGCDSIVTLDLTLRNYNNVIINAAICQGQIYNGKTTSGTYIDSFKSVEGCDSFRTLYLVVNQHSASTIYDTICQGRSSGGHTTSGTFFDKLVNAKGCDSNRTLYLVVKPNSFFTINKTICEGDIFLGRMATGNYSDVFMSANGCDSTRYLNLYVSKKKTIPIPKIICEGDVFMTHTTSGFYIDTLRTSFGCDSIITHLTLTVIPKKLDLIDTICEGDSSLGYKTTGVYIDNIIDANNCPRIRKLTLTVIPTTYGSETRIICYGDTYKGKSASGIYSIKYVNVKGCDSFFTLNLTVKPDFLKKTLRDTATCFGYPIVLSVDPSYLAYKWNDNITTATRNCTITDQYIVTVTNHDTCKSTDTCDVLFHPIPTVDIGEDSSIYKGELLIFNPIISGIVNKKGFKWTPSNLFYCDSCIEQKIELAANSYIKLFYRDANTCFNSDSIYINVLPVFDFGFPTAFSPNGDGVNDYFEINGGPVKNLELSIYNRWGEKIYESIGSKSKWDGKYKGEYVNTGVYSYVATIYEYGRKIKEKWGTMTIVK
jgi:gliding motility-associated-like protein